jgi:hypothetical protein
MLTTNVRRLRRLPFLVAAGEAALHDPMAPSLLPAGQAD